MVCGCRLGRRNYLLLLSVIFVTLIVLLILDYKMAHTAKISSNEEQLNKYEFQDMSDLDHNFFEDVPKLGLYTHRQERKKIRRTFGSHKSIIFKDKSRTDSRTTYNMS